MPQIGAIGSALSLYRSMMNREAYGIALAQRHHFRSRLHPRTLFGQHELSSGKIPPGLRKEESHLDREDVLSIEILMKAVVVADAVLKQECSWPCLSSIMATLNEVGVFTRISDLDPHRLVPLIGDGSQFAIKRSAQALHDARQWIAEILVLPASKAVTAHNYSAAESRLILVQTRKGPALMGSENALERLRCPGYSTLRQSAASRAFRFETRRLSLLAESHSSRLLKFGPPRAEYS